MLIATLLSYGKNIGSILSTQTQLISSGTFKDALDEKFEFIEDINFKSSKIHLIPNITVATMEVIDKFNYPVVPYGFKACGCACMLELGSYRIIAKDFNYDDSYFYRFDGLFTYD